MSDVTEALNAVASGEEAAQEQLLSLVYGELRSLAAAKMARELPGQTLQATALVHEAWVKLIGTEEPQVWKNRGHFFGAAAEAMRRILVDRARRKASVRHGGGLERVEMEHASLATEDSPDTLLAVHDALDRLAQAWPEKAEIVKMRYFTGLEMQEIAEALGLSLSTVERHWAYARAWLYRDLAKKSENI